MLALTYKRYAEPCSSNTQGRLSHVVFGLTSNGSSGYVGIRSTTFMQKTVLVDGVLIVRSIKIHESADDAALTPILISHATWSMTWITADSIVVAYPELTFKKDGMEAALYYSIYEGISLDYLFKWWERGFQVISRARSDASGHPCRSVCPTGIRSTHDKYVCRMLFNGEGDGMPKRQWLLKTGRHESSCSNPDCPQYGVATVIANASL